MIVAKKWHHVIRGVTIKQKKINSSICLCQTAWERIDRECEIIYQTSGIRLSRSSFIEMLVMMRGKTEKIRAMERAADYEGDWQTGEEPGPVHD